MEQERLSKGIWIPIEIWKDKNLTWNEKILFLEIDSYTSNEKDCFFSNEYISELLGISETNANKTLSSLIKKGYVIKTKFDGRRLYVKTALSYSTRQPCQERQPSLIYDIDIYNNPNKTINKEKESKLSQKSEELFEKCWIAYRRKGSKKKSKECWSKLNEQEQEKVLPHIKAYVSSRDLVFQKDFERYLRDKVFLTIVFSKNDVVYDPTKENETAYIPETSPLLTWNDYYNCYMYLGFYDGHISDGYDDDNRPNGASIRLNNGRGTLIWDATNKIWDKQ